ncbi:GNAT family N-acetyltransferase [Salarchaeum sp. JOR-1]|uniref:GNAT family N-acetyltransferase n=1 Tax=Salarchaeum sp. JOR-1 TaxID=2599399 RepID=UPI0011985F32|nr:GNAT family N-acetyltransferase [Salarchaeum sp. JOR-1]QDX40862.1 GNAT family N-acetyltransferase [Salarchaeum sp. JOR-1]
MTTIEAATTDDLDALVEQWAALVEGQRRHGTHLLAAENRNAARGVLGQRIAADQLRVARDGDGRLGFATYYLEDGLYDQDATRGIVENVYVDPPHRNQGIGSRLLDAAETELEARGADTLAIAVMADNDAARGLYESRGYAAHRVILEKPAENDTHTNPES